MNTLRPAAPPRFRLWPALRPYRGRLLATYAMVNVEFGLLLAQPWACGRAVTGLAGGDPAGLGLWVGLSGLYLAACVARRRYDTRTFGAIYAALAADVVGRQRAAGVAGARVLARVGFLRQLVEFLERTVPFLAQTAYTSVGAVAMMAAADPPTAGAAAAAAVLAAVVGGRYGRAAARVHDRLHDALEREADVVAGGRRGDAGRYYAGVADLRTELSDREAWNFGLVELLAVAVTAFAAARACTAGTPDPGRVSAALGYAALFGASLLTLPAAAEQVGRLRDILRRVGDDSADAGAATG